MMVSFSPFGIWYYPQRVGAHIGQLIINNTAYIALGLQYEWAKDGRKTIILALLGLSFTYANYDATKTTVKGTGDNT